MGFDYWAAKRDGVKDDEISEYLKQTTGKGFDFDAARKNGVKNDEIAEYLSIATAPKQKHSWRVDGTPDVPDAKPKYNVTAVAAAPELFKEAPEDVKAAASAGIAMKAIDTLHNSKPSTSLVEKAYNYANSILQKGKFAVDTASNGLLDGITPNTIADTAKEHIDSDKTAMSKINSLKTGFSDEDLISAKQIYNPSKQTILSDIFGEKPTYTEEAVKRYGDNLISTYGDKYFVKLTVDDNNKLTPFLKQKDDENAVWQEPKADGIDGEIYNSFVAALPISTAQAVGGMSADRISRPISKAASSLPGVWGKVASTAVRGASFGIGAAAATPAGVAVKNATSGAEFNNEDTLKESITEMKDSALFDGAVTTVGVGYQAVKPILPNVAKALGKGVNWTAGRFVDGNSPSIDKVMSTAGVTPEQVSEYQARRARFESVPEPKNIIDMPDAIKNIKYVGKVAEAGSDVLNSFKPSALDAKRRMALDATLGGDDEGTMLRHLTETMQEFPEAGDKMSRTVSARASSLKKEFDNLLINENGKTLRPLDMVRSDMEAYHKTVSENFGNMTATWRELFPEKIDIAEASGLKEIADDLASSISRSDVRIAGHLDSMNYLLQKGGNIADLFTLRRDLNKLSAAPATHEARESIRIAKENIDTYIHKAASELDEASGDELMKATKEAYGEWAYLKDMEDTPLFAKTLNNSLSEDDFVKFATKEAGASDLGNWTPLLERLSPQSKETLENSILAKIVNDAYAEVGAGAKYIDWQKAGERLGKIDEALFTTQSAKENFDTLREAADVFKTDKVLQQLTSNIASGTHSAGLATTLMGAAERWWVSRTFKRLMMYMPTTKSENMAFRLQLAKAIEGVRTPLEMLTKIEKSSNLPNYVKTDFAKLKDEFLDAIPQFKDDIKAAMNTDMTPKNFEVMKQEWDALVREGELFGMRDAATANNKKQAFDYFVKKGMSPDEIAKKLRVQRGETEEFPYYVDANGNVYKTEPFDGMDAQKAKTEAIKETPKQEEASSLSLYKAQDGLYTKEFAQALAAKEPDGELAKHIDKIVSGEVDEAAAKAYMNAIEPYTSPELHALRKEMLHPEEVAPAQKTIESTINKEEAKEVSEALYFADNTAYKEFGKKQGTLDRLFGDIAEGKELSAEQKTLFSDIDGYVKESGALEKYRAEKEAAQGDNIAKLDDIGEYIAKTAEEREAVEAEAAQINKIVNGKMVASTDKDIEETLKGMGIFEKIKSADEVALDEITPKWIKEIQPKAERYYEKYKLKELPELERIHTEALDRMIVLQERLYAHDTQAKALADGKAIVKVQEEIGKLKAIEWASGGVLKATGGSGMLGGMANGLEYDSDGNIVGVDAERFLIGFVGGAMAGAIVSGKAGQKAIEFAAKKLEPLQKLALEEGNALAARLHDKLMDSYFAPVKYMAPVKSSTQKEKRGIYNVQFNGKNSTNINKDASFADEVIKYEKGKADYINNDGKAINGFGALHIDKHLDETKDGWVTQNELLNIGEAIRNTKPYERGGKRIYEYYNDGNERFRVVIGDKKDGERTISFYSNRKAGFGNDSQNYIYNQPRNEILHQDDTKSQVLKIAAPIALGAAASQDEEGDMAMLAGVGGVMAFRGGRTLPKGFFSKLESVVDEKFPNRFGESAAMAILRKNGVKDEELKWVAAESGLSVLKDQNGNISKSDFVEWAKNNRFRLSEKENLPTQYSSFTLPQTTNYREILITAPDMSKDFKNGHWQDPKTLMHIRAGDIELDGQKTLMIEEIQSDLHQATRQGKKTPEAPLSKTWHEYGIKRMIQEAVDGGYGRVAWTSADTQNERNGLAHVADEIIYNEKSKTLSTKAAADKGLFKTGVKAEELPKYLGKALAEKLMEQEANKGGGRRLTGEAIKVGGEGMEGFYDKMLPNFTKGYIKKYDAALEKNTLEDGTQVWSFAVTPKMREDIAKGGQPLYTVGGTAAIAASISEDDNKEVAPAKAFADKWRSDFGIKEKTDSWKEKVKKLFARNEA